jgi:predicted ribosomally synthesized peptide with SipW-like signal peptide
MGVHRSTSGTTRRRKVLALISMVAAVGVTSVGTLAAWNDNEWVFGGAGPTGGSTPGVGTSTFEVVQDAWTGTPPTATAGTWADHEENPGDALVFNVDPNTLTPGDTIYAPVALTTTSDSIGGTLRLQRPVAAATDTAKRVWDDADGQLWASLRYTVTVTHLADTAKNCGVTGALSGDVLLSNRGLDADLSAVDPQALSKEGGNIQYYCFAITLPNTALTQTLQGRAVFPAWRFAAESA